jgi:hypothetical protein
MSRPAHKSRVLHFIGRAIILIALVLLFAACQKFGLVSLLDGDMGMALTVEPTELHLLTFQQYALNIKGGYPPYTLEVIDGGGAWIRTHTSTPRLRL